MNETLWHYLRDQKKTVHGWLQRVDAEIIGSLLAFQHREGIIGAGVEIGVHHGKSFIPICLALREHERALCVDIFDDQQKNLDASGRGDLQQFLANLARFHVHPRQVRIFRGSSEAVSAEFIIQSVGPVRYFSIDGGHWSAIVQNDLRLAEQTLANGGVIALDDYCRAEWPDVTAGYALWRESTQSDIVPFAVGSNKLFLCGKDFSKAYRACLDNGFLRHYLSKRYISGDAEMDCYRVEPFEQDEAETDAAQLLAMKIFQPDLFVATVAEARRSPVAQVK